MKTKDLIAILQKLVDDNEEIKECVGGHEIMIDFFSNNEAGIFIYQGFSTHINIEKSGDGVYDILSCF